MSLEYNLGVKSVTNKSDLLDKYAMVALPGTNFPKLIVTEHPLLLEKVLRYLYLALPSPPPTLPTRHYLPLLSCFPCRFLSTFYRKKMMNFFLTLFIAWFICAW
jgi:hypothetical protein